MGSCYDYSLLGLTDLLVLFYLDHEYLIICASFLIAVIELEIVSQR